MKSDPRATRFAAQLLAAGGNKAALDFWAVTRRIANRVDEAKAFTREAYQLQRQATALLQSAHKEFRRYFDTLPPAVQETVRGFLEGGEPWLLEDLPPDLTATQVEKLMR